MEIDGNNLEFISVASGELSESEIERMDEEAKEKLKRFSIFNFLGMLR